MRGDGDGDGEGDSKGQIKCCERWNYLPEARTQRARRLVHAATSTQRRDIHHIITSPHQHIIAATSTQRSHITAGEPLAASIAASVRAARPLLFGQQHLDRGDNEDDREDEEHRSKPLDGVGGTSREKSGRAVRGVGVEAWLPSGGMRGRAVRIVCAVPR